METRRQVKRKSACQDNIFLEVNDNDLSPEHHTEEGSEPEVKIMKTESICLEEALETAKRNYCTFDLKENDSKIEINNVEISCDNLENVVACDNPENVVASCDNLQLTDIPNDTPKSSEKRPELVSESEPEHLIFTDITHENNKLQNDTVENNKSIDVADKNIIVSTDVCDKNLTSPIMYVETEVHNHKDNISVTDVTPITNLKDENSISEGPHLEKIDENDSTVNKDATMQISFGSEELADLYKFKFLKFLSSFVELEIIEENDFSIVLRRDPVLNPSDWIIVDETFVTQQDEPVLTTPTKQKKKAKKKKKAEDMFVLDTTPSNNDSSSHVAQYSSKFQIDLGDKEVETVAQKNSAHVCFNCNQAHNLKDCPVPRDYAKINAARNKFKSNQKPQSNRYHLEEEQKYSHLKPGKLSPALREAMGLRQNEIPCHVYRMRFLGYPPGWLEEAKFVYSNLDLFDVDGKPVRQGKKRSQGLDPEKIIDYPGFNVPMEKNMKDEYKYYGVPRYSDKFNKKAMIEYFEKTFASEQDDYETCEMDLDTTELCDEGAEKEVFQNSLVKELKESVEIDLPSPSLVELEKQKENLLMALEDNTSASNIISEENTSEEPEKRSEGANDNSQDADDKLIPVEECVNLDSSADEGVISEAETSIAHNSAIKSSNFGTPILKTSSPYSKLPNLENFTKDVSPVINFENLPNSTGKYEQMTGVLQKVRNKMKNLQNCKS